MVWQIFASLLFGACVVDLLLGSISDFRKREWENRSKKQLLAEIRRLKAENAELRAFRCPAE